jgi:hypothetical protein
MSRALAIGIARFSTDRLFSLVPGVPGAASSPGLESVVLS